MSSEKPSSIRLWLSRYKPDRVRCTLRTGELRELPKPTAARGQWAQLERAIIGLSPTYLEAFHGETCLSARAMEVDDEGELAPAVNEETNPLTALVQVLPTIVQLIVDAGDAAAARQKESYETAFREQLSLVKVLSDRLGGLERAWHKMILDRAAELQSAGSDPNDMAAMSLIGNIMGGAQAKPNGAAKPAAGGDE